MENKVEKPFEITFSEAKESLYNAVNKAYNDGVSFYLLEVILSDILHQVSYGAKDEIKKATDRYNSENENINDENIGAEGVSDIESDIDIKDE